MDPKLVKALRELLQAQRSAAKAGTPISPADADAFIREETGGKHTLADAHKLLASINTDIGPRNLARSAVQGATFDFGDELLGMLPQAIGGGPAAEDEMRLRQDLFREQHPYADGAAGLAGGVASGLLIPGGAAATVGKTMARGALIGAGAGALAGAGRGEDLSSRASGAVTGGVVGGALGAAVPGVLGAVKSLAPARAAGRLVDHAIEQSGGADALRGQTFDFRNAGRGDQVMLADLSDPLRLLGDRAVNNSDDALAKIAPSVMERSRNGAGRILNDAREVLGERPNAVARAKGLKRAAQEFGNTAYDGLRADNQNIPLEDATLKAIQQPLVKDALQKAHITGLIGPEAGTGPQQIGFATLHEAKRALDGAVSAAARTGDGYRMEKLIGARDLLMNELMTKAKGFPEINAQYGAIKSTQRALADGLKAFGKEDVNELADAMSGMTTESLEQFRYGLASKMYAKLSNAKTNRDTAKELMDASDAMTTKLKIAFGSKEKFAQFMARVEKEAQLAKAKGMFGNSATQRRAQAAGFDPLELVGEAATGHIPGAMSLIGKGMSKLTGARQRAIATQLGDIVSTKGAGNIDNLLETFTNPEPLLGRLSGTAIPAGTGGLLKF